MRHNEKEQNRVSDYLDAIQHVPISEILEMWKTKIAYLNRGLFAFYVACGEDKKDAIDDYLQEELGVPKENKVEIQLDGTRSDLIADLRELKEDISALEGDKVLVLVNGFEKILKTADSYRSARAGHDYDQNVAENQSLNEFYNSCGKKIFIVTHVGFSEGNNLYDTAVRSAVGSQFKDGLIEVK